MISWSVGGTPMILIPKPATSNIAVPTIIIITKRPARNFPMICRHGTQAGQGRLIVRGTLTIVRQSPGDTNNRDKHAQ
jgi:hypothetical protein